MAYNQTHIIQFTTGLVPSVTDRYDMDGCLFLARSLLEVRNKEKTGISCREKKQTRDMVHLENCMLVQLVSQGIPRLWEDAVCSGEKNIQSYTGRGSLEVSGMYRSIVWDSCRGKAKMNHHVELSFISPSDLKNSLAFLEEENSNLSATSGAVYKY